MKICFLSIACIFIFPSLSAQGAKRFDLLITEIMPIPSPPVGLPAAKYLELKNVSGASINLKNWKLCSANSTSIINQSVALPADSFVLLCTSSNVAALSVYGRTIGVTNFPTLYADGDVIWLLSPEGKTIHAAGYSRSWFQNDIKSKGGWSLEMIDTHNPCNEQNNWAASTAENGGTPGKENSVSAVNHDTIAPFIVKAYAQDNTHFSIIFNEPLDSVQAIILSNYSVTENNITAAIVDPPLFKSATLTLADTLQPNKPYDLVAKNISDCSGNTLETTTIKTGLASHIDSMDIVINEILFDPTPLGTDYVELYNRSNKIFDAKDLYIANRSASGVVGSIKQLTTQSQLIFPNDYIVITESAATLSKEYLVKNPDAVIELSSLPSFPISNGDCLILNNLGQIIDELAYDEKWHFELITNPKGVALERIDYNKPTQDKNNWHSAATSAGYGTPTYQNSQFQTAEQAIGNISITPTIFSPDNDGVDDFATITYQFPDNGYVCNITIFDANGRPVRNLVKNGLCSQSGYFRWDGLDEQGRQLNIGPYIVFTEVFNLQGKTKRFKNVVVVARRLR